MCEDKLKEMKMEMEGGLYLLHPLGLGRVVNMGFLCSDCRIYSGVPPGRAVAERKRQR